MDNAVENPSSPSMPRFSLKSLFAVSTAAVLLLGVSQCRRQMILAQVEEVRQLGGQVELPASYVDRFWQRRPTRGQVTIGPWADEANLRRARQCEDKLKALGITEISRLDLF
jgi:hypothetical protein